MIREIEIKIKTDNIEKEIQNIQLIGAALINDFEFEDNLIFDFENKSLKKIGTVLRIRKYGEKYTVTVKEKISGDSVGESKYKIRSESETEISNFDSLKKIFKAIGLDVVYRYQKYRAIFKWKDLHIYCDKTPIGDFLELEGKKEDIDEAATKLGYMHNDYISISYLAYHMKYLESKGLPPEDLIFKDKK